MATTESRLVVSLVDRLSGAAKQVTATLDRLTAAQQRNNARLDAIRGRMLEAGAVAYGLARAIGAPTRAATEFETKLEDIAQKINAPVEAIPELGKEIRAVARDVTQSASAIAEGMDVLTGMGAERGDALALLGPIGKAATAYKASIADLSQAGYAALDNLKVPADQFGRALDAMAQAGKAGAFELKDMASYFPALGAGYQALGQEGVPAVADLSAALQIVRKGTGDSASAATNLSNVLQKIRAPATVAAFKKMGVNLEKELARAAEAGLTPIEAIAEITNKTLKGDLGKLGYLFADAQVQAGLRPLIQNIEEYRRIRADALAAQGVVEADYQRRLQTGAMAGQRFAIAMENVNVAIGAALLPALSDLADTIVPIINRMAEFAEAHPQLTRVIVGTGSALIGLRIAALAAQFSLLWMKGGAIAGAIAGLRGMRSAINGVGSAFKAFRAATVGATMLGATGGGGLFSGIVAGAGSAVTGILSTFAGLAAGIATITAPVWGVIALVAGAVAGLALTIYNYWVPISEFVKGFVGVIFNALSDLAAELLGFGSRIASAVGSWATEKLIDFGAWLGIDEATVRAAIDQAVAGVTAAAQRIVDIVKAIPGAVAGWIGDIFTMNQYSEAATSGFRTAGEQAGQALVDAIKAAINGLVDWFRGLPGRIASAIGSIDLGSLVKWPRMPSWLGGSSAPTTEVEARATGGPVAAGRPYLIGERGPELMVPKHNGFVVPNHLLSGGGGPVAAGRATRGDVHVTNHNTFNITGVSDPERAADIAAERLGATAKATFEAAYSD